MGIEEVQKLEQSPIQHFIGPTLTRVLPIYGRMSWCVLQTDDQTGFVTTDSPVTWFNPAAYRLQPFRRSAGLLERAIEVTMPLSPSKCLIITHDPTLRGFKKVTPRVVDELNRRHIEHCASHFISRTRETRPIWFEKREIPEDAWEKVRERKIASGEWTARNTL